MHRLLLHARQGLEGLNLKGLVNYWLLRRRLVDVHITESVSRGEFRSQFAVVVRVTADLVAALPPVARARLVLGWVVGEFVL
jgi:hypothetical protein